MSFLRIPASRVKKLPLFQVRLATLLLLYLIASLSNVSHANDIIDFESLKGKVVYLDFWASWCGPCKDSFPWLNKMHEQYKEQGFEIIAVNLDQESELADRFLHQFSPTFNVVFDPKGELARAFNIQAMPTSFLINRDGKAIVQHDGFHLRDTAAYESEIIKLLDSDFITPE